MLMLNKLLTEFRFRLLKDVLSLTWNTEPIL